MIAVRSCQPILLAASAILILGVIKLNPALGGVASMFPAHVSRVIVATMRMAVPSILIESIDCGDALDL